MTSRSALNLGLLAAVGILAWFALRPSPESVPEGLPVTTLAPSQVSGIRIERPDTATIRLQRQDTAWLLEAPMAAPADGFRVQALLGLLETRSTTGFRAAGNDLRQYGLSPPQANLYFDELTLAIGIREPVKGRRYLLDAAGDQVHLIQDGWFSQIFGDAAAWVDPRPLPADSAPVLIRLPAVTWRLEQGSWKREPENAAVSADAGVALADAWQRARALSVTALDPRTPWQDEVAIALRGRKELLKLRLAVGSDAVLLGRTDLGVQYRFLPRQGKVLLSDDAAR